MDMQVRNRVAEHRRGQTRRVPPRLHEQVPRCAVVPSPPSANHAIRIARPSLDLGAAERFYVDGLGLSVLFKRTCW
jgi:hypothetical protein